MEEIFPLDIFTTATINIICGLSPDLCIYVESLIGDKNPSLNDAKAFDLMLDHFPAGASL